MNELMIAIYGVTQLLTLMAKVASDAQREGRDPTQDELDRIEEARRDAEQKWQEAIND